MPLLRANSEEDKAAKVFIDAQTNREETDVRVQLFPDGADNLVMTETKSNARVFAAVAESHNCTVEREDDVKVLRLKRSQWGRSLHSMLFTHHARVDVLKFDSALRRFVVGQTGTPAEWSQLESYVGDDVEEAAVAKPVVAVHEEKGSVGLFVFYKVSRVVSVCSFIDNASYDALESALVQLAPMECFVSEEGQRNGALAKAMQAGGRHLTNTVQDSTKTSDPRAVIKKFEARVDFSGVNKVALETDERLALIAGSLISKMILEEDLEGSSLISLKPLLLTDFMRLSASTVEGLNIVGGARSLYKLLSFTRTSGGDRLLRTWLNQPLVKPVDIRERLDMVEVLVEDACLRKTLHEEHLRKISDLDRICGKMRKKRAALQDLYKAFLTVLEGQRIYTAIKESEGPEAFEARLLGPLSACLPKLERFTAMVDKTLDLQSITADGVFQIKSCFDEDLGKLKEQIDKVKAKITGDASKEARSFGLDQKSLKLESSAQLGFYYRVTLKDERNIRQTKGLVVVDSNKAGVKFRTRTLETRNGEYLDLMKSYDLQQQAVIDEVTEIAAGYVPHFQTLAGCLSTLDCLVSFATASVTSSSMPYVKPTIVDGDDKRRIQLKQCRHPCVEQMDGVNYIPNDANLSDGEDRFFVITGPNLGGKSTYMRSVALTVYMAQIGCFVPCESAEIAPVDQILVRIGASDCQYDGVSTFMAEMLDASRILRNATKNSLILIDELGRGTSTYDGFGLAWSISHHISTKICALTLFATHFYEMTTLAREVKGVGNLFCDALADGGQFTLLYSIKPGVCKKSFGVEVAKMAGFPEKVLERARSYLKASEHDTIDAATHEKIVRITREYNTGKRKAELESEARELAKRLK